MPHGFTTYQGQQKGLTSDQRVMISTNKTCPKRLHLCPNGAQRKRVSIQSVRKETSVHFIGLTSDTRRPDLVGIAWRSCEELVDDHWQGRNQLMFDIAGEAKPTAIHLSRHHLAADFVPVRLEHIKNCLDLFLHPSPMCSYTHAANLFQRLDS